MRYKKTIRRSVQDKTAAQARKHIRGYTIARRLTRKAKEANNPAEAARQSFLNGLTNWQRNQLLRRVGGDFHKHSVDHLKIIMATVKRAS